MVDDGIIVSKTLSYAGLQAIHFGQHGINELRNDAALFRWPSMRANTEKTSKVCSACLNVGILLQIQITQIKNLVLSDRKRQAKKCKQNLRSTQLIKPPIHPIQTNCNQQKQPKITTSHWQINKTNTGHETSQCMFKQMCDCIRSTEMK